MKILFDHNLPRRRRKHLPGFEIHTAKEMKWEQLRNGALMTVAIAAGFDVFVTIDKQLEHQQNLATLPLPVVVLDGDSNALPALVPFVPILQQVMELLDDRELSQILRQWEAPSSPPSLTRRVLSHRRSWWHKPFLGSIRVADVQQDPVRRTFMRHRVLISTLALISMVLFVLLALPSTGVLAQQFLRRFFVGRFEAVRAPDPWPSTPGQNAHAPQPVSDLNVAARLLGFVPRFPRLIAPGSAKLSVGGPRGTEIWKLSVADLTARLRRVGASDVSIPPNWDGIEIEQSTGPVLIAEFGDNMFVQLPPNTIVTPAGFPITQFVELYCRIAGMTHAINARRVAGGVTGETAGRRHSRRLRAEWLSECGTGTFCQPAGAGGAGGTHRMGSLAAVAGNTQRAVLG